jgi:hypothetical protein
MRKAAFIIRAEIDKVMARKQYSSRIVVDWCVKLARVGEAIAPYEYPRISPLEARERNEYAVQVQADLSRLNADGSGARAICPTCGMWPSATRPHGPDLIALDVGDGVLTPGD